LAECSWVVKLQANEGDPTGMRETIAMDVALQERAGLPLDELMATFDPYDQRWDRITIPNDPLLAVRTDLDRIQASLRCRPEFNGQSPFPN
jgi:hypothetical protein